MCSKKNKILSIQKQAGFTMIELVLVIAILGILAVAALPNMFNIAISEAVNSSAEGTVGSVRAGLSLYASNQVAAGNAESYPTYLEVSDLADDTAASRTVPLFTSVIQGGVTNNWFKVDDDCYAYDTNNDGDFDDGTDYEYQYNNATTAGTFVGVSDCGS